jgi:hypothetical protein
VLCGTKARPIAKPHGHYVCHDPLGSRKALGRRRDFGDQIANQLLVR